MKIARLLIYIMILSRLTWQERAQLKVISHERSREGTVSVVLILFYRVVYIYSYVLRLSLINQLILDYF
jgi:hypothetical protein